MFSGKCWGVNELPYLLLGSSRVLLHRLGDERSLALGHGWFLINSAAPDRVNTIFKTGKKNNRTKNDKNQQDFSQVNLLQRRLTSVVFHTQECLHTNRTSSIQKICLRGYVPSCVYVRVQERAARHDDAVIAVWCAGKYWIQLATRESILLASPSPLPPSGPSEQQILQSLGTLPAGGWTDCYRGIFELNTSLPVLNSFFEDLLLLGDLEQTISLYMWWIVNF